MKKETLDRAIELNRRLKALETFSQALESSDGYITYMGRYSSGVFPISCSEIKSILAAHDEQIRQEVADEIQNVKKEIEQL